MKFENILTQFSTHGLRIRDIEQFLEEGGSINHRSANGKTLLHYAAEDRDSETIRFLVSRGASLDLQCEHGDTPLHVAVDSDIDYAVQFGRPLIMSTVAELINAGASEKLTTLKSRTPRDIVACYGQYAIDLYDTISRTSSINEPTLDEFSARCIEIINASGYDAEIHHGEQISIAENSSGHKMTWHHLYIISGEWYHQRHNVDFPTNLVAFVRSALEKLKAQRSA